MLTWNIKELEYSIGEKHGNTQKSLAIRSLVSIFENQDFSRFHYHEIKDLISQHMIGNSGERDYFKLVMTLEPTVRESEEQFNTACKAHIISLLRQMHSIPDLLAHGIYYCLGFNLNKETLLNENKVSLHNVKKILEKSLVHAELLNLLNSLTECDDFKYLKALGNYTKHRFNIIPRLSYSIGHVGEQVYEFTFDEFKSYPRVPAIDFLNREYDRQSELIITIGNQLNELVAK